MLGGDALIVGLTGKTCAGKDAFAAMLPQDRFAVIDVDRLGHKALEANHEALEAAFGPSIFASDGSVDRKVLGPIVFADAAEAVGRGLVPVINAALLESMGFVEHCSLIILVTAPLEVRMRRAAERDGISSEEFMKRARAQKDIGLSLFSSGRRVITVINDSTEDSLSRQVENCCGIIG